MGCGASTEASDPGAGYAPGAANATGIKSPLHGGSNAVTTRNPGFAGEFTPALPQPYVKPTFANSYVRGAKLGKGNYATVYKVSPKGSNKVYAAKVIKKAALTPEDIAALAIEVKAMTMLQQHPNFVHIVEHLSERCGAAAALPFHPARQASAALTPLPLPHAHPARVLSPTPFAAGTSFTLCLS